jgi:hypothetical protein
VPPPRRRRSESVLVVGITWCRSSGLFGCALVSWRRAICAPTCARVRVGPSSGAAYPAFDANLTRQQERPAAIKCAWVATWLLQKRCASSERPRSPHNATLRVLLQRKRGLRPGPEISAVRGASKHRPPRWCVCVVCLTCPHCVLFCYPSLEVRWYRLEKAKDRDTQTKTERDFV